MAQDSLTRDDLRAAVASGVLTEAQAARLLTISEERLGYRKTLGPEDEPFELFRGFAEIFVSVGLVLLISGILAVGQIFGGAILPFLAAGLCWVFARYFTLKRRMALPSIVLVVGFALGIAIGAALILSAVFGPESHPRLVALIYSLICLAALALHFRVFKVPFTALPMGLAASLPVFIAVDLIFPFGDMAFDWTALFDLAAGSGLPVATLIFGLVMLVAGLWCDMKDPYRLGRWSATGFWCHILAAPALVNTVALTAYSQGDTAGNLLLALALVAIGLLALVIDRRSFLTAGIGYLGLLIAWVLRYGDSNLSLALLLLILGAFLTAIGTYWTQIRAGLMRALPDFPGKDRLPPYADNG
ncbi:hypothetical protein L0V05_05250 [Tabrizicola sp. J26]|uniref:hypothetical protein n=1 Tax=Alitabrizicola rongguiensis TaxID=2909234 RepID=UPI001F21714B|nr:hypothetical protein [Tabrizicola rongguiensis]MCF1708224.1 hypothetical protein [Tabrizicola rongguiensis]